MVPIPGTRRVERLTENAGAARLGLSADDLAELDALPAPMGARYSV
jgi:aryl-alcohol dehydrogenase-like predicted oxidoreductase